MKKTDEGKTALATRAIRGLGWFNVAYATLGLLSAFALRFLLPQEANPIPDAVMIGSAIACLTAMAQGVLLIVYGDVVRRKTVAVLRAAWTAARGILRRQGPSGEAA